MKYPSGRPPRVSFLRRRRRPVVAALAGMALLAGIIAYASVSSAGEGDRRRTTTSTEPVWPALADAAKIPNDQGPSPECAGTPAPTPAPTATAAPTAPPTVDPTADPTADPSAPPSAAAAFHHHGGGGTPTPTTPPASCHEDQGGPTDADFIDIRRVAPNAVAPQRGPNASVGTFVTQCGRNENNHRNSDNFIVAPGVTNGAHHTHDYVGNLSASGASTDETLAAAGTTCRFGDKSTFYWPVLRLRNTVGPDANADGGGNDLNVGRIIRPSSVQLQFRGNAQAKVVAMPRFIRIITGDAKATTNGPTNARAQWTCTGFTNRVTTKYPLCPRGSQVQRILNLPSCWDGKNTDSANHRAHIVFPDATGACPAGTQAVPQLRMTLTYSVPPGRSFSLDSFPEQLHNPLTDHADFANVMPDGLMAFAVDCINRGRRC